jgi:hypothetical protein
MALILKDRVRETSSSSGTGNITLGGAISGYQTFNAAIASGSTVYYTIHNLTAGVDSEWEVGLGTFTSPATLARTTVLSSSNSGSAVNFTAGASGLEVFITQPAEEAVYINQATGKVEAFGNGANIISFVAVTSDLFTGNGSAISVINASNISSGTIDNSRTTAASANGASTIVLRDSGGSFDANLINAVSISGNAATVTGINASNIASGTIANARTTAATANGASTIVLRGASGEFAAGAITGDSFSGNGVALTAINASNISSGTVATARLGSGTANSSTFLRGDQTYAVVSSGTLIPAGTVMIFGQTAAPTGFTKLTDQNNAGLRVVSGTASTGGSVDFTTAFASQTPTGSVSITSVTGSAGSTTLSTPQIPSHSHPITIHNFGAPYTGFDNNGGNPGSPEAFSTNATGGGGSHDHPFSFSSGSGTFSGNAINLAVKYVDVIRATKD